MLVNIMAMTEEHKSLQATVPPRTSLHWKRRRQKGPWLTLPGSSVEAETTKCRVQNGNCLIMEVQNYLLPQWTAIRVLGKADPLRHLSMSTVTRDGFDHPCHDHGPVKRDILLPQQLLKASYRPVQVPSAILPTAVSVFQWVSLVRAG